MHARSGTSESWAYQVPAFTAVGFRAVAYDRRGWGQSRPDPTVEQPGFACDDLQELVEHLGLDRFHIVAIASGATPAVDYALTYPDPVRSLVLADCTCGVRDADYLQMLARIQAPELQALPPELGELGPSYRAFNPEGTQRWIEIQRISQQETAQRQRARKHVTFALLETLRMPVLALAGEADLFSPPAVMRLLVAHIPNCQYVTIPDAGHAAFWEQPEVCNRIVLEFLNRC